MTAILIRRGKFGYRPGKRAMWRWRQRPEWCVYKPRNIKDWQPPPEAGEKGTAQILPHSLQEGSNLIDNTWVSDFSSPCLVEDRFLLFWVTQLVVAPGNRGRAESRGVRADQRTPWLSQVWAARYSSLAMAVSSLHSTPCRQWSCLHGLHLSLRVALEYPMGKKIKNPFL